MMIMKVSSKCDQVYIIHSELSKMLKRVTESKESKRTCLNMWSDIAMSIVKMSRSIRIDPVKSNIFWGRSLMLKLLRNGS